MKANTRNIMQSNWEVDDMNLNSRCKEGCLYSGMPAGKHLNSPNSRRAFNRHLKNKWRNEIKKQYNQEIEEI